MKSLRKPTLSVEEAEAEALASLPEHVRNTVNKLSSTADSMYIAKKRKKKGGKKKKPAGPERQDSGSGASRRPKSAGRGAARAMTLLKERSDVIAHRAKHVENAWWTEKDVGLGDNVIHELRGPGTIVEVHDDTETVTVYFEREGSRHTYAEHSWSKFTRTGSFMERSKFMAPILSKTVRERPCPVEGCTIPLVSGHEAAQHLRSHGALDLHEHR